MLVAAKALTVNLVPIMALTFAAINRSSRAEAAAAGRGGEGGGGLTSQH